MNHKQQGNREIPQLQLKITVQPLWCLRQSNTSNNTPLALLLYIFGLFIALSILAYSESIYSSERLIKY